MQLKNVIFDFGQVMIRFDPHYMTAQYVSDPTDAALLETVVFDRLYWDRLDSGEITDAEVLGACRERLPARLWEAAERIYGNWYYHLPETEGMRELVRELKARGMRVLLLSNISAGFAAHAKEFPLLAEFDGCVLSAEIGMVKPHAAIFEYICKTYDIKPSESLFIDDSEKNIRGSEAFGIKGYLFDGDVPKLKNYLQQQLP